MYIHQFTSYNYSTGDTSVCANTEQNVALTPYSMLIIEIEMKSNVQSDESNVPNVQVTVIRFLFHADKLRMVHLKELIESYQEQRKVDGTAAAKLRDALKSLKNEDRGEAVKVINATAAKKNESVLHTAVAIGDIDTIALILQKAHRCIDLTASAPRCHTPLHEAARLKNVAVVETILENLTPHQGLNLMNVSNKDGQRASDCSKNCADCKTDSKKPRALVRSCNRKCKKVLELLEEYKKAAASGLSLQLYMYIG